MIGRQVPRDGWRKGGTFLTGHWASPPAHFLRTQMVADLLHRITHVSGSRIATKDHKGEMHEFDRLPDGTLDMAIDGSMPPRSCVIWSEHLPSAPFSQIARLSDALHRTPKERRAPPLLLLASGRIRDGALCQIVEAPRHVRTSMPKDADDQPGAGVLDAIVLPDDVHAASSGDLLVLCDWTMRPQAQPCVAAATVDAIAAGMTPDKTARWMPADPRSSLHVHLACGSTVSHMIDRATASTQVDAVLLAAVQNEEGNDATSIIASSGIVAFDSECLDDEFYDPGLDPGLWVGTNLRWTGSDDAVEIDCRWRPAHASDLSLFGITPPALIRQLSEYADEGYDIAPVLRALKTPVADPHG